MQIVLNGKPAERTSVVHGLEEFCRQHQISKQVMNAADIALEEHLTNVLNYGYEAGAPHRVVVDLKLDNGSLCVDVADDGKPYDPLARPPVDTSLPLAEKPIGGLGVHLMRQFMDDLSYAREAGKNVLRMRKQIEPGAG